MNSVHETHISRIGHARSALSIIEVLTSMVVAMIGVFGVMILIPFAVKQAQVGMDSDAAVVLGRNAYSRLEIEGYRNPTNWGMFRDLATVPQFTRYSPYVPTDHDLDGGSSTAARVDFPEVFSIDPLGIAENGGATLQDQVNNAWFPFNRFNAERNPPGTPHPYPNNLMLRPVTLVTPTGGTMIDFDVNGIADDFDGTSTGESLARRMCLTADDLVFGEAVDELLGPEQAFDQDSTAAFARRQSRGHLSWSAIVVPFKRDATTAATLRWSYKMYILVYKNRQMQLPTDPEYGMATARVTNTGVQSPVSDIYLDPDVEFIEGAVNRDDWVMLINRNTSLEDGFQHQLAFYRVVGVSDAAGAVPTSMTLDGSDFAFSDPTGPDPTFVVHLKDVVGVYERTFEPEFESNWNGSF